MLTLTTTPGLASLWLIPRLADFVKSHPGTDVRIDASYEARALAADGYDLAIRYGRLEKMAGTPLFEETLEPVCSPQLLAQGPPLASAADLRHHTLLQMASLDEAHIPVEWQSWLAGMGVADIEPMARLTFNNYDAAVAAAVAGQGVALGRRPIIDRLLRQGALVAPFGGELSQARGYAVVMSIAAQRRPAALALRDWLLAQARLAD